MTGFCNLKKAIDCLFPGLNQQQSENPSDKQIFHFLYYISRLMSIIILLYFLNNLMALNVEDNIQQLEQSLSQNYINDIIVNQTCDVSIESLQYNISQTKTGCQCQEQIYPYNCSYDQKLNQNCTTINPNQQINLSKFPFQKGQNVNFGIPIWLVRGSTSPMDKLQNKNYKDGHCIDNYKICSNQILSICQSTNELCPLSNFEIEKNLYSNTSNIIRDPVFNKIRNTSSFISNIILTNGSCFNQSKNFKQNDYILNEQSNYIKYPMNLRNITQYQIKSMLSINDQLKNYYIKRPGLDEQNGTFEICALSFDITEECSYNMLDLINKVKIYYNTMLILVLALLTTFIFTFALLIFSYISAKVTLISMALIIIEVAIILSMIVLLVFNNLYNSNINDRCWLLDFDEIIQGYTFVGIYGFYGVLIIIFVRFSYKRQNLYILRRPQTSSDQQSNQPTPINKSQSLSIHRQSNSSSSLIGR